MSTCAIIVFRGGKPDTAREWRNSWGGAAFIWDALFAKYLKNPNNPFDSWLMRPDSLWRLDEDARLNASERACLLLTFDNAVIHDANFKRAASDLREFAQRYHKNHAQVCHLYEWADFIEECDGEAVGFYHTSVSENPWSRWGSEKGESEEVPLSEAKLEVYEELAKLKAALEVAP